METSHNRVLASIRNLDDQRWLSFVRLNAQQDGAPKGTQMSNAQQDTSTRAAGGEGTDQVKSETQKIVEQQKDAAASKAAGIAGIVHKTADEMESQLPQAAKYAHELASNIGHVASELHERSLDDLLKAFTTFARTQPMTFIGSAVFAGFAFSRFLKSSSDQKRL
jgi:hypothetical protein